MKRIFRIIFSVIFVMAVAACRKEAFDASDVYGSYYGEGSSEFIEVPLTVGVSDGIGTKATYLNDVESRSSGAMVLAYRSDTKAFVSAQFFTPAQLALAESSWEESGSARHPLTISVPSVRCDFYVMGNFPFIKKSTGEVVSMVEAVTAGGAEFFDTSTALENYVYRFDGGTVTTGYRRADMPEVATYGLPYVYRSTNVDVVAAQAAGGLRFDECKRLFAKVVLNVDHSGLDNGNVNNLVDKKVYVRCGNIKFMPFKGQDYANKAESWGSSYAYSFGKSGYDGYSRMVDVWTEGNPYRHFFHIPSAPIVPGGSITLRFRYAEDPQVVVSDIAFSAIIVQYDSSGNALRESYFQGYGDIETIDWHSSCSSISVVIVSFNENPDVYFEFDKVTGSGDSDVYEGAKWVDYDDAITVNARTTTYTLYVPENMQGNPSSLVGNTNPYAKTSAYAPFGSRIHFYADVNRPDAGLSGHVGYEFMLGKNNVTNFDVEGGKVYPIELSFKETGLLTWQGNWKMDGSASYQSADHQTSIDTDSRHFRVTKDAEHTDDLGSTVVVVRPGQTRSVYLFANPTGDTGTNYITGSTPLTNGDISISSLTDYAVGYDYPDGSVYTNQGLDFDIRENGRLDIWVANESVFNSHVGEQRRIVLKLRPYSASSSGTNYITRTIYVKSMPSISAGLSVGTMYLGQHATASVSGMNGTPRWRSVAGNNLWNNEVSGSLYDFPGDWLHDGQSVDVYAFRPGTGTVIFSSDDPYNDGEVSVSIPIEMPSLRATATSVVLPFDGDSKDIGLSYYTTDGSAALPKSAFDATLWDALLANVAVKQDGEWDTCVGVNVETGYCWMKGTVGGNGGHVEDMSYNTSGTNKYTASAGRMYFKNLDFEDYCPSYNENSVVVRFSKPFITGNVRGREGSQFGSIGSDGNYYNDYFWSTFLTGQELTYDSFAQTMDDSSRFGVQFDFQYVNGDNSQLGYSLVGDHRTYTASNGETFVPRYRFEADGNTGYFMYYETDQAMEASNGEPVPGGLIVPYGAQHIILQVSNRYDGRTCEDSFDYPILYRGMKACYLVVARAGQSNASVYVVPQKAAKYLKRMANDSRVGTAQRSWMMRIMDEWDGLMTSSRRTIYDGMYRQDTYVQGNFYSATNVSFPLTNYSATYFSRIAYDAGKIPSDNIVVWGQSSVDLINDWQVSIEGLHFPMWGYYIGQVYEPTGFSGDTYNDHSLQDDYDYFDGPYYTVQALLYTKYEAFSVWAN